MIIIINHRAESADQAPNSALFFSLEIESIESLPIKLTRSTRMRSEVIYLW